MKRMTSYWNLLTVLFAIGFWTNPTVAQTYKFTTLDDPLGTSGTSVYGISGGTVVGLYLGSSYQAHGFVYNGSTWTTLSDYPSATPDSTIPYGISGSNIVGTYQDSTYITRGFLYNGSTFTSISDPSGTHGTEPQGIDGNNIVGDSYVSPSSQAQGFFYNGSKYMTIDDPSATGGTYPKGISGNNIVGYAVEDVMNECLGWTGNGNCDGGDIGSGSINIFCFVVDPQIAAKSAVEWLRKKHLLQGAIMAYEKDDDYIVLWPKDFSGKFSPL